MNSTYKERLLQDTDERSSAFLTQFSNRLHIDTCEGLEVALAKYPLLLRHLGGENDLVHHPPAVQSAHQSHRLGHHQLGCGESSVISDDISQHAPRSCLTAGAQFHTGVLLKCSKTAGW